MSTINLIYARFKITDIFIPYIIGSPASQPFLIKCGGVIMEKRLVTLGIRLCQRGIELTIMRLQCHAQNFHLWFMKQCV